MYEQFLALRIAMEDFANIVIKESKIELVLEKLSYFLQRT